MAKTYVMKDLGYPRMPTSNWMIIQSEDGRRKAIPIQAIVDSRDENYADDKEDTIGHINRGTLDPWAIKDWAGNNMNFSDVEEYAVDLPFTPKEIDWQDVWNCSDMVIVPSV